MRRSGGRFAILLLAGLAVHWLAAPAGLVAQQVSGLIRAELNSGPGHWLVGRAAAATPDSVYFVPERSRDTLGYARSELRRIQVSRGRHSRAGAGALVGGAAGAVGGILLTTAAECEDYCPGSGAGFAVGALVGAGFGALVGAFTHHEKWEEQALKVGLYPKGSRGIALSVTLRC
jgi:hypothetical protein